MISLKYCAITLKKEQRIEIDFMVIIILIILKIFKVKYFSR